MRYASEYILQKLPLFNGNVETLASDQSVGDIIQGVKEVHKKYACDYDLIAEYFLGSTPEKTCKNIFDFIRRNSFYYVEDETLQTLRSPSAILATGKTIGIDCKNMALFIGGVIDAINRTGLQYIPFVYRFASDKLFDATPNHVFIVAFPGTDNELWIDPIPQIQYFNQQLFYSYHTDKKFSNMLQVLSGRSAQVGFIDEAIDVVNIAAKLFNNVAAPNPNDWQGWTPGDAKHWVILDGDSVQNEAINIISWIKAHGASDLINSDGYNVPRVTAAQIANKLVRGGYPTEAAAIAKAGSGSIMPNNILNPDGSIKTAGVSPLLLLGGAGLVVYALSKSGRKVAGKSNTLLWIAGGVAAYYLLKKPQDPLQSIKADLTAQKLLTR